MGAHRERSMDWVIKLACGWARERRTRKNTAAAAMITNETAMANNAARWPADAMVTGIGAGAGAGRLVWLTGETGATAGATAGATTDMGGDTGAETTGGEMPGAGAASARFVSARTAGPTGAADGGGCV